MRVLFIVSTFPPGYTGGAEVANYATCRGLIRQGVDCSILVLNNRISERVDEWYELDGIPVHRVTHRTPRSALTDVFDWRIYQTTKAELRHLGPDLVHMHNVSGTTLAPYLACRSVGIPVVNTLHDLWLLCPNNMLYRQDGSYCDPRQNSRSCGHCFRRYDFWGNIPRRRQVFAALTSNVRAFISPSQAVIDRHVEAGYDAQRFRLVRLGFEEPKVSDEYAPLGLEGVQGPVPQRRTIVFVGGGIEIKGAHVLLQALPTLLGRMDNLQVIVAGSGEERFLAGFRGYYPAVRLVGTIPFTQRHMLFALADLTLVPSVWHENSPVTIYDSFSNGTPVVGSRLGGIPEFIRDGETGYLFPAGNPEDLAETVIAHFARPPVERRLMRRRCVEEVRTRLTLENHIQGLTRVYQEVLSS
jgi:glycosyltransferase involved in cell wall biosynthesis